jgi:CRISPR-associated endonuclease/helicase Cas3
MVLLFRPEAGGYHAGKGWTGEKKDIPEVLVEKGLPEEAYDDDQRAIGTWQSLGDHSTRVIQELKTLLDIFPQLEQAFLDALLTAARWHDAGKAHPVCQRAMLGEPPEKDSSIIWAKTARSTVRYERRGFRHELASALAMLNRGLPDLAAYLAAAHHGKVRLSIRSLPMERSPREADRRFARGIWEGDELPSTELGGAEMLTPTTLDLSYMELGEGPQGPSWLARTLALRDASDIGPFRLAFLESLLRVADWRASRLEEAKNA